MDTPSFDLFEQAQRIISQRRSIKPALMDASKEVSDETWTKLFECANWAPCHGLTEPWRFQIYRGDARQHIALGLQQSYQNTTQASDVLPEKLEKLGKTPFMAHATVAIIMYRCPTKNMPKIEEIEAVACAVQNFHLAASSMGLGAFWSSPTFCYTDSFHQHLGLSVNEKCLGLLYVGYPKEGTSWPESTRTKVQDKVTFIDSFPL